ncbi:MAG: TIM barrel protein [Pirellulales bacterium]
MNFATPGQSKSSADSVHRRTFLRAAGVTGAAVVLSSSVPRDILAQEQAADDHPIGRHIYKSLKWNMVRTPGPTLAQFKMLKELGYDGVEIDSPGGVDKEEAIAASRETGLPIEGVVNSTHWNVRHSDPDPAVRQQALENMKTAMRDAKRVGADSVLLVPGKVNDPLAENHDQVWERSITEIRKMLPLAEELQMKILIENVGNGFCTDPRQFARYIDEIDSPLVGVHFDIGNHIAHSPPADWIRILGRRIRKLDVKDRNKTTREMTLIGEGDADWPAVRQALEEVGYRGWVAAEVRGGDRERLADVVRRMNNVLGKSDGMPGENLPGATREA